MNQRIEFQHSVFYQLKNSNQNSYFDGAGGMKKHIASVTPRSFGFVVVKRYGKLGDFGFFYYP